MLQTRHFEAILRRLYGFRFLIARGFVVLLATVLVVAGVSMLVDHLFNPETIAKVRLQREGYTVDEAAAFQAIDREDILALVRLKTAGVSLLCVNEKGWTPYEAALRSDRLEMLDVLAGLESMPKLKSGVTTECLVQALERGALETADLLLGRGTNPNLEVEPGLPLLVWSITTNREKAIDLLIRHKANIEAASKVGTPLVLSYAESNFRLFDRLLSLGANPNQLDMTGRTLGAASILDGRPEFTRRLLSAKADVNAAGRDGISMLEAAFRKRMEPLFVELVQAGGSLSQVDGQRRTFLERTAEDRDHPWMRLLLAQGVDPNQRTAGKNDPVWWNSFQAGDPVGAEVLLGAGADINARDGAGKTPIELAVQRDSFPVTRYLFARGAKSEAPLWDLLQNKNYDLMRLVMANGTWSASRNALGLTPISFAIRNGDVTGAALLMEYGGRIEKGDRPDGHSLLEWALAHRQLPMIEFLIAQGVNVNETVSRPLHPEFLAGFKQNGNLLFHLKGDSNVTPLMIAAGSHQLDVAQSLLSHGAKRLQWTRRYRSDPVTFAIRADDLPMAQLMLGREPELNGNHQRKVVVSRSDQRARFYKNGELVYSTRCSTGKSGYRTPGGTFVITDKARLRYSTLYGAAMPYFHRLSGSAIGMHEGYVPGYPASHGCIRLPYSYAKIFYEQTRLGDIVVVE